MALGKCYKAGESAKGQQGKEGIYSPASQAYQNRGEDGTIDQHAEELLGVGGRQRGEADAVA